MHVVRLFPVAIFLFVNPGAVSDENSGSTADAQPLIANVNRLLESLSYLGAPLPEATADAIHKALDSGDSAKVQAELDRQTLFEVSINPELRVKVARGQGDAIIQQAGFTPVIVKINNDATVTRRLQIFSPQSGPVYSGSSLQILKRQAQPDLKDNENVSRSHRFLNVEIFDQSPMTDRLSGLTVEYVIALINSSEAGMKEATISFDIGQGTQDLGFRSEVPILFSIRKAIPVRLQINDDNGRPTTAKLEVQDKDGRIYPPQAKRLAPDFFFQPQIYRSNGDTVLLPPGRFQLVSSRGPEYRRTKQDVVILSESNQTLGVQLKRWVNPQEFGFYSGDHHIHAAGCSHYDNPTQGVAPMDMFRQIKGEGLNVGCVLTWGPCFDHQRQFFSPIADSISEPQTVMKYDLEISGFGSSALGHVCLLNLNSQNYPGSDGTATKGWPTWTVPVMRWARQQGGITGYPHSALAVDPKLAAEWQIKTLDTNQDGSLDRRETRGRLLAESFAKSDTNRDKKLSPAELQTSADLAADMLPNYALPSLNGGGAMEIFVTATEGVCDFISAMDTARIPEWNTWYHLLNCGFAIKLSGETDFPCMSSRRVGQGRVYVQLGDVESVHFEDWCRGIANGNSYVSDGFAHALEFSVNGTTPGTAAAAMPTVGVANVEAKVAFAPEQPRAVAYGTLNSPLGKRITGDTVHLHAERDTGFIRGGKRLVELVKNGIVIASQEVQANGEPHSLSFDVEITESCWLALRQFPQLHTNPVYIEVAEKPMVPQSRSALWCAESVRLLWHNRNRFINDSEKDEARATYKRSLARYLDLARQNNPSSPVFELE